MTSKSLVAKWLNDLTGYHFSRQYIIKLIISFTRLLNGLCESTIQYALSHTRILHFDETTYRCIKVAGSCYMWVAVTGKHEKTPVKIFYAAKGRGHEDFLKMFGITKNAEGEFESNGIIDINLDGIESDAHSAYPKGIQILKKYVRGLIAHAICFVHVRREFLKALDSFGLLKKYQKAFKESTDKNFKDLLKKIIPEKNSHKFGPIVQKIIKATYLIDLIIGLDTDFICTDRETIKDRREKYSKNLLDEFFGIMRDICDDYKEYIVIRKRTINKDSTNEDDKIERFYYSSKISFPHLKAVVYSLNHEIEMYAFIFDGDIETHNNIAEATIRQCVKQRNNMLFLFSTVGYTAYGNAMTLMTTCETLGINKYRYIQWAFDCAKKELHEQMFSTPNRGNAKNNCYLPNVQKDENGKVIDFFDERYQCPFDSVKWYRYTPYKYKEKLDEELEIVRQISNEDTSTHSDSS